MLIALVLLSVPKRVDSETVISPPETAVEKDASK
jgi:hypothetical protein